MTGTVTPFPKSAQTKRKGKPDLAAAAKELEAQVAVEPPKAVFLPDGDERLSVHSLPIDRIVPGDNPRLEADAERQKELNASVKEHGILQPIRVRPLDDGSYQIVAGFRRYIAARTAKLDAVPVVVATAADSDAYIQSLVENLQREDLDKIDEAKAFQKLLETPDGSGKKLTQSELAKRVGKSQPYISNSVRLLELPEELQERVQSGDLQPSAAKAIVSLPPAAQKKVATSAVKRRMSTAQIEQEARWERERIEKSKQDANRMKAEVDALKAAIDTAIKARKVKAKTLLLFHSERYIEPLTKAGVKQPMAAFNHQVHTTKNGRIDCKDDALLFALNYQAEANDPVAVCTDREHVKAVEIEERQKAEAEFKQQIDTVNEARTTVLAKVRSEDGSALTEDGLRLALYSLYVQPFQATWQVSHNALTSFYQRYGHEIPATDQLIPKLWAVIQELPLDRVTYELVGWGIQTAIPNVYADDARHSNRTHAPIRAWFVKAFDLDESIIFGGHPAIEVLGEDDPDEDEDDGSIEASQVEEDGDTIETSVAESEPTAGEPEADDGEESMGDD